MRTATIGVCGVLILAVGVSLSGQRVIRHEVHTDRVIDWPIEAQQAEYKEMDAKKLSTVRVVEAGHISLNARRLVGAETALIHGDRGDVWLVREGSGTLVTGGELVDAKRSANGLDQSGSGIRGGVERVIKAGDIVFIPPGVPHGIKESKAITWTNVHYAQKAGVWPHFTTGGTNRVIRNFAPIDRAIDWPLDAQQSEYTWMDGKKISGVRVVEGGVISLNARRERGNQTFNLHEDEGDIWLVQEGSGLMVTGGEIVGSGEGRAFKGGQERMIKAGDIIYVPPRVVHGIKETKGITWLNIHFAGR